MRKDMDSQTRLKLLKELEGYRKQDIAKLPQGQKLAVVKRIREIALLVQEPISIDKSRLSFIVIAVGSDGREHRVIGLDGNPDLGMIPEGIEGVKSAPIRLQEETLKNGHLQRHLEDLQKAGYASVEDAVIDIARSYEQIYEGKKDQQLVLVKPVELKESEKLKRGILLTEFQEVAGIYRVGSVLATSIDRYLRNRKLLWDKSHTSRLSQENLGRTRGLTGPEQNSGTANSSTEGEPQGKTPPIRLHQDNLTRTRELTGPEPSSDSNDTTSTDKAQNNLLSD